MNRTGRFWALAVLLAVGLPGVLNATMQDPVPLGPQPADSSADSTAVLDSIKFLPVAPDETPLGPLAPGNRITFDRESILWSGALTVADLLAGISGVYVARGGFFGQPEYVLYAGNGPASVEVYWDGMPFVPVGGDSIYVDLGRVPLSYLKMVQVELLPTSLVIYLVSERTAEIEPRSKIEVLSGAFNTAHYAGLFQRRWQNGFGLNLAADFGESRVQPLSSNVSRALDVWVKLDWLPREGKSGAVYQFRRQEMDRDERTGLGSAIVPARNGRRTDVQFRLFTGTRPDHLGLFGEIGFGTNGWITDSGAVGQEDIPDRIVQHAFGSVRFSTANFVAQATTRIADSYTTRSTEGRLGWVPVTGIALSALGRQRDFIGARSATDGTVSASLYYGPLSLVGSWHGGTVVQAPSILSDSGQAVVGSSLRMNITTKPLSGTVALERRGAFLPLAPPDFPQIPSLDSVDQATYLVGKLQLRPLQPLFFTGSMNIPQTAGAVSGLQPPRHGRFDVTFRSKFFRTFQSGTFDLLLRYGVEFWGAGSIGAQTPIQANNIHDWVIQFRIVGFTGFFHLRNSTLADVEFVPGLTYPANAQTFGVKWEFRN